MELDYAYDYAYFNPSALAMSVTRAPLAPTDRSVRISRYSSSSEADSQHSDRLRLRGKESGLALRVALWGIVERAQGLGLGDKGYLSTDLKHALMEQEVCLETPLHSNMRDTLDPAWVKCMTSTRRLIETVIGQLSERYHIEKVLAGDLWHLTNGLGRKILAHTLGVLLNWALGRDPLQFDGLIVA